MKNHINRNYLYGLFLAVCMLVFGMASAQDGGAPASPAPAAGGLSTDAAVIAQGASIFKGNCQQCHQVHKKVVGPALANVWERRPVPWLVNFIKYPQKTIESGDDYAVKLYNEYKQFMPNHDFLKDDEILAVLAYVQDETKKGPAKDVAAADPGAGTTTSAEGPNSTLLTAVIAGLSLLLVIMVIVMAMLVSVLTRYVKAQGGLSESDQEFVDNKFSLGAILRSQAFIGIAAFVFVAFSAKTVVDGLFTVGVQQGYAPDQPIPFSHKLHAGYYEIDCKYCHTTVEKSKQANIPSANICMNCHNSIKQEGPWMQKLYEHIEQDKPIQWVRIHNMPDLAYFNHAQHVKVGGIECETCHGDIKNMEVVQQHSLLTMGWCIDCHRKTDVNAKGNAYYDRLIELHAKKSKEPMKVQDIGGLECAKCHY